MLPHVWVRQKGSNIKQYLVCVFCGEECVVFANEDLPATPCPARTEGAMNANA
jgi:hypothetical protein